MKVRFMVIGAHTHTSSRMSDQDIDVQKHGDEEQLSSQLHAPGGSSQMRRVPPGTSMCAGAVNGMSTKSVATKK